MICLILVVALGLRLFNLNQSLWLDEAVQAITAQKSFIYIFQEIRGDFHPPLYHFFMHFWVRIFGGSEIILRAPSVIFGVLTVWLIYKFIKELNINRSGDLNKEKLALVGSIFMATAPFHLYYSQEARKYSLACFLASLSMLCFIRIQKRAIDKLKNYRNKDIVFWFFSTILLIYSDYYGFLVLAAQFLILLLHKRAKFLSFCLFIYLLIYLPWLPMFIVQLKTGAAATRSLPEWGRLVNLSFVKAWPLTFIKFSLGRITVFNKTEYLLIAIVLAVVYGGIILQLIKKLVIRKLKDCDELLIVLVWLAVPLILAWVMSLFIPSYQPFRLLLVLPAFYILLVSGLGMIKLRWIRILGLVFVLGVNLLSLSRYYSNPYFQREDWRGLTRFLIEQNTAAILPSATSNWPIKYYNQGEELRLVYGVEGVSEVDRFSGEILADYKGAGSVYYIRYLVPVFDPEEKVLSKLNSLGYQKIGEISFNQIEVWEFSPPGGD